MDDVISEIIIDRINNYYTEEKRLILLTLMQQEDEEGARTRRLLTLVIDDEQASHLKPSFIKSLRAFATFATKHTTRIMPLLGML